MNILLSRYFEAGDSGWIFYLCNNFSLLLILAGLTIENAINYYSSQKTIDDTALTWFAVIWTILVSFIVIVLLWFYFGRYKDTSFLTREQYLYYAVCYVAGIQLTNIFTILFYANKNFFLPNFLMVLLNLVVIIFIPKQSGTQNTNASLLINLYFAFFIINGVVLAAAFIIKKKTWRKIHLPTLPAMRLLIRYALMALAANVIFFLVYRIDYWFVKRFCTPQELGNYIQISKLAQMLLIIPSIIASVIFPHAAGGMQKEEMKENILRIGRITTLMYAILFALMALTGYWMFPLVFGNTFTLMYVPFLLLLPGVWALSNLYILSAYFGGVNKVKVNIHGAIFALVVIFTCDIIFIPKGGIVAAAIISSIGYFVNFLYAFIILQREHVVSFNYYFSFNKDDIKWLKTFIQR